MMRDGTAATLGLVAGLGVGAGIFYYRSLVQAHLQRGLVPRIVMVHADAARVMALANARESRQLAAYLAGLLTQLAGAGAHIATIPAFSPQVCAAELEQQTPLPLIGLLDAIAAEVSRRHLARVAVFGARITIETSLFGSLNGVADVVAPRPQELDRISGIYSEIVKNETTSHAEMQELRSLAWTLLQRERLDEILLAGTDLSFVFHPGNTDFPHLDGARTHIDAILQTLTA